MKLKQLQERLRTLATENAGLMQKFPDFDFDDEASSRLQQIDNEFKDVQGQIATLKRNEQMARSLNSGMAEYLSQPAGDGPTFPASGGDGTKDGDSPQNGERKQEQRKALAQWVLDDEKYKAWLASVAPRGQFSKEGRINSPQVIVPGGLKALVTGTSDTSAGAFVFTDIQRNLDQYIIRRQLVMRDIITIASTTSDLIEYVRQVSETNNAAMVPEAQSTAPIGDGTGGTVTAAVGGVKPESAITFERVQAPVRTIAHWMPATKRSLADAGQMQTLIDSFLRYGLEEELEDQMVLGNGAGENFEGLASIENLTAQEWDTDVVVTTRKAKTKARVAGRARPNAYLLNPYDWETIQLTRTNEGGPGTGVFFFGGPAAVEVPTLWNLPVVESESVPQGIGYVGDFRQLILWDREEAGVQMTDAHADFFVRNLVAILAEARAAFGCLRPAAICEIDLTE